MYSRVRRICVVNGGNRASTLRGIETPRLLATLLREWRGNRASTLRGIETQFQVERRIDEP